jgi:hypothetical protein
VPVDELGPEAASQLAEAVAFAHPAEARRDGLEAFVRQHRAALLDTPAPQACGAS